MKKFNLIVLSFFIIVNIFFLSNLQSQINNIIVIKVGESLITSIDIQNEIITKLVLSKQEITQENIEKSKPYAIKNLISKSMKKSEIEKYQIKKYSKKDLQKYVDKVENEIGVGTNELKQIFKKFNLNYAVFVENHKIELLWNTLIFTLYKNQTNINIVEVENEIAKNTENMSEDEIKKIRESILNKKKEEKLNLFSRSHFSNLENTIAVNFQ